LLGGGLERGSSTLILGPAGTGKSTFSFQLLVAAVARGEKVAAFIFDEELGLLFTRLKALGIALPPLLSPLPLPLSPLPPPPLS
ncbi:ATPase domain-containing protein, partial [Rhizobium ruizarguesonis]